MKNASNNPAPPDVEGLEWRLITRNDPGALVELAQSGYQVDGGLGFLFVPEAIQAHFFSGENGTGLGAFLPDGRLAAGITVHLVGNPGQQRAKITGLVRPGLRGKGLGTYLLSWSESQARQLCADEGTAPGLLQVATESLSAAARRLYLAHGFQSVFEELVMERALSTPLPEAGLPPDVTLVNWQAGLAEQFFCAYQTAFRERPGFPGYSAAEWIGQTTESDFKPEWSFLARVQAAPSGFVLGYIDLTRDPPGGYIGQVGVAPAQRRRGLASLLLVESMRRMQAEGVRAALLAVHVNNPGALEAYTRIGFKTVGRRARFERLAEPA